MQTRIRPTRLFAVVSLGLVLALAGTALGQSSNPRIGTWKLNLAKSTYAAGTAPKSATFTVVAAGAGVKVTVDGVNADGTVSHWMYTANYDGKDYPVTGNPNRETVAATLVDANTLKSIYKKGGNAAVTQISVLSSDGKTITITSTSTDAKGQPVKSVAIYDRQ